MTQRISPLAFAAILALSACSRTGTEADQAPDASVTTPAAGSPAASDAEAPAPDVPDARHQGDEDLPELIPPAPGEPGGLADDRTPLAEGPIDADSAQGAGQVVQQYAAFLEEGRFADAYRLWGDNGRASDMSRAAFARSFEKYSEIHALVGAPGGTEGAAGSIYVTVPLQLYGRMAEGGAPFNMIGPVTLRRVNNVPGATPAQLRWHISNTALRPRGTVREGG